MAIFNRGIYEGGRDEIVKRFKKEEGSSKEDGSRSEVLGPRVCGVERRWELHRSRKEIKGGKG